MSQDVTLEGPVQGIDQSMAFGKQPPLTTLDAVNVRSKDNRTGRTGVASRPMVDGFAPAPLGTGPVRGLASTPFDITHTTFSVATTPGTEWSKLGPSSESATSVRCALTGDTFILEGGSHVVVRNKQGVEVSKVALPVSAAQVCRALTIDALGRFYVGVSAGGGQLQAALWAYRDDPYRGWVVLWVERPGFFIEKLQVVDSTLHALVNDLTTNRAYVLGYTALSSNEPERDWIAETPAPGTCLSVSVKGDVLVGSGYNSLRGINPSFPNIGQLLPDAFADFNIEDLNAYDETKWVDIDAANLVLEDGENVTDWTDGSQRRLYVAPDVVHWKELVSLTSGAQPLNTQTFTIAGVSPTGEGDITEVYRFVTALAQANDILIGATVTATLTNLSIALTQGGTGTTSHINTPPTVLVYTKMTGSTLKLTGRPPWRYITVSTSSATLIVSAANTRSEQNIVPIAPKMKKVGLGGLPEVFFDGLSSKLTTQKNPSKSVTGANQQHSLFPAYGAALSRDISAKFYFAMVCRPYEAGLRSTIIGQRNDLFVRRVVSNRRASSVSTPGWLTVVEYPNGGPATNSEVTFVSDQNFTLVEIISYPSTTAATNDIEVYVNGTLINTPADAAANDGLFQTTLGQMNHLSDTGLDDGFYLGGISRIYCRTVDSAGNLMSTAQRQLVEGVFAWKYGGQANLPGGHPYQTKPPPPAGTSTIPFHNAQKLLTTTPIVTKLHALTHEIAYVLASDLGAAPATIGGLGSGLVWNNAGDAWFSIGVPVLFSGPGADIASIRKVIDQGRLYSLATVDGAWSVPVGAASPQFQTETFTYDGLELAVDQWDNVFIPFHNDRYRGAHLAFWAYDTNGVLLLDPVAPDQQLGFSIGIQQPVPVFSDVMITRPELIVIGQRRESTAVLSLSALPAIGDDITFSGMLFTTAIAESYTFAATLGVSPNKVLIGANSAETLANLKAAINRDAGEGVIYSNGTGRAELVSGAAIVGAGLTLVARRYEGPTTAAISGLTMTVGLFTPSTGNVRQMRLVDSTLITGQGVDRVQVGVSAGVVSKFTRVYAQPVPGVGLSSVARYNHACVLRGKVYVTDGSTLKRYDPRTDQLVILESTTKGNVPEHAEIIEAWRSRLIATAIEGYPYIVKGSRIGTDTDWDTQPPVITGTQAFSLDQTLTGENPTRIVGFIPYMDDLALILCDPGLYRLTGDPAPGANGQRDVISDDFSCAFGRAWARGPSGEVFLWSGTGRPFVMAGPSSMPQPLDLKRQIANLFENLDLSQYFVRMAWNWRHDGLNITFCPFGGVSATSRMFFWERTTNAFWEDVFENTSHEPTDMIAIDGNSPQDSLILFGCKDGRARTYSELALTDDGTKMKWRFLIGPIAYGESRFETTMQQLQVLFDQQSGESFVDVFVSDSAGGQLASPASRRVLKHTYTIRPGRVNNFSARASGGYLWLGFRGSDPFAFDMARLVVGMGSARRVRVAW